MTEQNERLHAHLESMSAQASLIRQAVDTPTDQADAPNGADDRLSDLRAVVSYLRKEKEIVDLHLEVSKQETARSRTDLEHLSRLLKETRAALSEVSISRIFVLFPGPHGFRNASVRFNPRLLRLSMMNSWNESIN